MKSLISAAAVFSCVLFGITAHARHQDMQLTWNVRAIQNEEARYQHAAVTTNEYLCEKNEKIVFLRNFHASWLFFNVFYCFLCC